MRSFSYLNSAKHIINAYDGHIPFAGWLKQFFKTNKKYGSSDRKQIAHVCYSYFRLGNAFSALETEDKLVLGLFLCSNSDNLILKEQKPEWNEKVHFSLAEKIEMLDLENEISAIFPFNNELSPEIDKYQFNRSFLLQPDLFLRIRPGKKEKVVSQLQKANIEFQTEEDNCLRLINQTKVDEFVELDKEAVIQDLNSQKTTSVLTKFFPSGSSYTPSVFDCCAASGGKSILIYDQLPKVKLTVTDIRESILINLRKRFSKAGINNYQSFIDDLSLPDFSPNEQYDIVICDAPCSGSGTWGRTPEQLSLFQKDRIDQYSQLQKKIAVNAAKAIKPGGLLLYITCSVFFKENEEVVNHIIQNTGLKQVAGMYYTGYDKKADSLFTALFIKE